MDEHVVRQVLYDKYIAPTKLKKEKYIGVELEMPIVHMNGRPVDFSIVHLLTDAFARNFQMEPIHFDDEGHICTLLNHQNGDSLSYDCSYNNLELSMGKEVNVNTIYRRFENYYLFIQDFFKPYQHTLTGMGIHPYRKKNRNVPILNERYRMLFHYLGSYKNHNHPDFFHHYPEFGTFSSASQVQIDVDYPHLIDTINVFSKLEPIKALLFSNSVMPEEEKGMICVRDMFWENSMHGINPKNIGMFERDLTSEEDLLDYITQTSIYCTMRDGKYVHFFPIPVLDFFRKQQVIGEFWNGNAYENITLEPRLEDLKYLRSFKFVDLTFRGTIEFRSCCCQPVAESMTVPAFHVGLQTMLYSLKTLLESDHVLYGHGWTASQLRKAFCHGQIPNFIDDAKLQRLIFSILDLAEQGLEKRGFGEGRFLKPLYDRIQRKSNPAMDYLTALDHNVPVEKLIVQYSTIT